VTQLAQIFSYKPSEFPLTYLGLSLSSKELAKHHYHKVVDSIQGRLLGYYADKLSIAGRVVILNSVFSAMLVYFMSMFLLPD
jgi:hypothetical protein